MITIRFPERSLSSEFERTIQESRAARLDSDQLKHEQDVQINESAIIQLKKVRAGLTLMITLKI